MALRAKFPTNERNAVWLSSAVKSDGTVRPCFFQPPLGNSHGAGSLTAVLNSPEAIAFRRNLGAAMNAICPRYVRTLKLREPA